MLVVPCLLAACGSWSATRRVDDLATVVPPVLVESAIPAPASPPQVSPLTPAELLNQYIDKVRRRLRNQMVYKGPSAGNPEVLFEIRLQPDMRIVSVRKLQPSGNKAFDQAVKRAIDKMTSYPPLPEGLDFSLFSTHKIKYRLHDLL